MYVCVCTSLSTACRFPWAGLKVGMEPAALKTSSHGFPTCFHKPPGDADKLRVAGCMEISPAIWQLAGTPMGSDVNRHLLIQGGVV
jgi:hypothetical protein